MARNLSSLTNLFLRQTPCRPNHKIRYIAGDAAAAGDQLNSNPTQIAIEVSKCIRTRPRWEQTIQSDFPSINFVDPNILHEIFKHQNNSLLSLRLFYWVTSKFDFLPDEGICNAIFRALLESRSANAAKNLLSCTKFNPDVACLESYIQCLCENGLIQDALQVFDELTRTGFCPSLASWNSALLASVRAGKSDLVWRLHDKMVECNVSENVDTVGYLIEACCIDNDFSKGYDLLRQVLEAGYFPNTIAFNKLIAGFCKGKNNSKLSALLHIVIAKNRVPDLSTYHEIIRGLCKDGKVQEGFQIFNDLKDRGYALDQYMYTMMIHNLCKMKFLGDARKLLFEMIHKGIAPYEYTCDALIYGLCRSGDLEGAYNLFDELRKRGYRASIVSCNILISRVRENGRTNGAHKLFEEMPQRG